MRLEQATLDDVQPFIDEAIGLGVEQFSFTGGEPFVNRDILAILEYALERRPCLVLTNATNPLRARLDKLKHLAESPNTLRFRVSLDHPNPERHDAGRGDGNFVKAIETMGELHGMGFGLSIARLAQPEENVEEVNAAYQPFFEQAGLPSDLPIIVFPDFLGPEAHPGGVPEITENCMTTHHTDASRAKFMCNFSKMVVKKDGQMGVYACTLVDDDESYNLAPTLTTAMQQRVMLRHHRCFSCFAYGASCSEK
jgi:molybdenum cofactor biosynthesis enzyme MoaA